MKKLQQVIFGLIFLTCGSDLFAGKTYKADDRRVNAQNRKKEARRPKAESSNISVFNDAQRRDFKDDTRRHVVSDRAEKALQKAPVEVSSVVSAVAATVIRFEK